MSKGVRQGICQSPYVTSYSATDNLAGSSPAVQVETYPHVPPIRF